MSSLCLAPVAIFFDRPFTLNAPGISSIAAAAGVALLSTALAYILYFRILAAAGATNLLLVTFLIPVSAILLGVNFLGESLSLSQIVGMFLIGLGLAVMDGRIFKRRSGMNARVILPSRTIPQLTYCNYMSIQNYNTVNMDAIRAVLKNHSGVRFKVSGDGDTDRILQKNLKILHRIIPR